MRHNRPVICALLCAGLFTSLFSQASEVISEQALKQKLALVKRMVTKIHHQTQANNIDTGAWKAPYQKSVDKINQVQQAIYQQDNARANQLLADTFALISQSRKKLSKQYPDKKILKVYLEQRTNALNNFIDSLKDTLKSKPDRSAQQALKKASVLQRESVNKKLLQAISDVEQAYDLVVSQITRLRNNETTTVYLNFDTPKDEYLYDLKRVKSFKLLLEMQLSNKTLAKSTMSLVNSHTNTANDFLTKANSLASSGKYQQALSQIAQAIKSQQRALRGAGLNIM